MILQNFQRFLGGMDGYWGPSERCDVPFCQTAVVCRGLSPSQTYTLQLASKAPGRTIGSLYNRSLIPSTYCLAYGSPSSMPTKLSELQHEHSWGGEMGENQHSSKTKRTLYIGHSAVTLLTQEVSDTVAKSGQLLPSFCNQGLTPLIIELVLCGILMLSNALGVK